MKKLFLFLAFASLALAGCKKGDGLPQLPEPTPGDRAEINGTIWATRNVNAPGTFAIKAEDFGMLYQWGVRIGWSTADPLVSSPAGETWMIPYEHELPEIWTAENDPCPAGWRVPTLEEISSLVDKSKVTRKWGKVEGVTGISFTDATTGNSIFFPTTKEGRDEQGVMHYEWSSYSGCIWSSTKWMENEESTQFGMALMFDEGGDEYVRTWEFNLTNGFSVRCVAK